MVRPERVGREIHARPSSENGPALGIAAEAVGIAISSIAAPAAPRQVAYERTSRDRQRAAIQIDRAARAVATETVVSEKRAAGICGPAAALCLVTLEQAA